MSGALSDLVILDLTQMLAGPYCTMLFADQGARVIKVEPVTGDPTRGFGPHLPDMREYGGYFQSTNRSKSSIAIDLKSEAGAAIFRDLVRGCHVVVENFRPGVMDRLGLGYESLAEINPALVYCAIRGFGDPRTGASPYQDWPSYDVVAQAMGGLISINGTADGHIHKTGPGIGDIAPALFAAFGIMAAVHEARRSGRGQFVDVAMLDAVLALTERIVYQHSYTGEIPGPEGNMHPLLAPFGVFPARDGHVTIACPKDHFWRELARIMGRPELGVDPCFATNDARVRNRDKLGAMLDAWTAIHTKAELAQKLGGRVPFGPVNHAGDIAADPHVLSRDMRIACEQPGLGREVHIAGTPVKLSRTPAPPVTRAPALGEHTHEVLRSAGIDEARICQALTCGAVR